MRFAMLGVALAAGGVFAAAPDGNEWQNSERLSEGKEKARAFFFSHETVEEALAIWPSDGNRSVRSLNSPVDWKFSWAKDPASRPIGFWDPEYDVSHWDAIVVPSSWQAFGANGKGGWGTPLYTNIRYPFLQDAPRVMGTPPEYFTNYSARNPVGSYRRDFELFEDDLESEIYLKFDGVDSFFYLWVNGRYVGFAKDSRSPAEFDVTAFVKPGKNTVALEVYRYSDGSYLEDQDMFRLSGIFRDTWLLLRPKTRVRDFFVTARPEKEGDFGGKWRVEAEVSLDNRGKKEYRGAARVKLYPYGDADASSCGGAKMKFKVAPGAEATGKMAFDVVSPALWSAEAPNCYVAVVELEGREIVSSTFGFRVSEIKNGRYYLNGQKIKLKGANRHETDPMYGHYVPPSRHLQDVQMLKSANCNAVRNAHYPQTDYFYFLCDTLGIYLVDEANVESHGYGYGEASLSHRADFRAATVDRNMSMVERNKNHPSVVIWSYGNEAGPGENFAAARDAIKARDLTRPTHYERDNPLADMDSNQYPSVEWTRWKASDAGAAKPFYISEYAHNMVNAMGNLKDYQDAIESSDVILGATIWDWVDQGLYKLNSDGKMIIGFGGDWGDQPNDGQFVMNGCVLSDRAPEPGFFEIRHVFQNWCAEAGSDGKTIVLKNKNYFTGPENIVCTWRIFVNGVEDKDEKGRFDISSLGPQCTQTFPVPAVALEKAAIAGNTVSVKVRFIAIAFENASRKRVGIVGEDQIDLVCAAPAVPLATSGVMPKIRETEDDFTFSNGKETIRFCKKTGTLVEWRDENGKPRIAGPLMLDAFRAPSSNEIPEAEKAMAQGLRKLVPVCKNVSEVVDEADALAFTMTVDWKGERRERLVDYGRSVPRIENLGPATDRETWFTTVTRWRVSATGAVTAQSEIRPRGRKIDLLRLGWNLDFPLSADDAVLYFGNGPWENYRDRTSGAFLGRWASRVRDFYVPYARNEDCGNRENVRAAMFGGLTVSTLGAPFAMEVNPYTPTELIYGVHPGELAEMKNCHAGFFAETRGLGGASCGPGPMARDIIRADKIYRIDLAFVPDGKLVARTTASFEFPPDVVPEAAASSVLSVVSVSSREPGEGEAENAVDGDTETYWHSQYGVTLGKHPHVLTLDAGAVKEFRGVALLARQDRSDHGRIKDCLLEVSDDGAVWRELGKSVLPDTAEEIELDFPAPQKFRYLRFSALSEQKGREWASLAEIRLY